MRVLIDPDEPCPRDDCPIRHLDESTGAQVMALPPVVREAITISWCRNVKIIDGSLCAEAVGWYLRNHAARGKIDSSQEERLHAVPLPKTTAPRRVTGGRTGRKPG